MLDYLGIAAHNRNTCLLCCTGHGADFSLKHFRRKTGFKYKADDDRLRLRTGNRQIIYRAVDGKLADRASGEAQRFDDEAVSGHREANAANVE